MSIPYMYCKVLKAKQKVVYINAASAFSIILKTQFHLLGEGMVQCVEHVERKHDKYPEGLSHSL